jgi:hypothetical protein
MAWMLLQSYKRYTTKEQQNKYQVIDGDSSSKWSLWDQISITFLRLLHGMKLPSHKLVG